MEKPPIAAVLEHYGATDVPEGSRFRKMKCPFHEDRNASASVCTEENRFRCFACDISGDSFDIITDQEGCRDFNCARACATKLLGGEYGTVRSGSSQSSGRPSRRVLDESGPVRGQRSLLSAGVRRKPLAGA
ncbi:CHC2 zinc finger domain-containing protein [Streptomyces sp. NPDC056230]|uniref:CHC2 zinc finger domain-containing protein n=1 Tax=Streptomyces sp. NPDC056230 TaxID=3345754 RepID=UPI0035E20C7C